ncbi:MAG TPA: PEPxxWA-CTERM sorting domain-containing protein [Caulobacteraceae bacterium]
MKMGLAGAVAIATLSAASLAAAASQSFETPAIPANSIQYGPDEFAFNTNAVGPVVMAGVTFTGFAGVTTNTASGETTMGEWVNTPYGNQTAFIQSYQGTGGALDWSVSGLTVGKTYTLSFADAENLTVPGDAFNLSAPGGATVAFTDTSTSWQTHTYQFTANSSSEMIAFTGTSTGGNEATAIDDLILSSVPEPATWAMMLLGLSGLGAAIRVSRRRAALAHAAI